MVRYQGHAASARVTVPFAYDKVFDFPTRNILDEKVAIKWRELGLVPSGLSTDAEFLRRAMLDTIGTTPTRTEIEEFLADNAPEKRTKLIDRLLDRPEYVDFWTLKWGDLLRVDGTKLGAQGMLAFNLWLPRLVPSQQAGQRDGRRAHHGPRLDLHQWPGQLLSRGDRPRRPRRDHRASLHGGRAPVRPSATHHPFEAYGQDDYYGLAAYFSRIRTKQSQEFGLFGREQVIYVAKSGEVEATSDRQDHAADPARR